MYVGEKGGKLSFIAEDSGLFDDCYSIRAGKYRRYPSDSWLTKLLDLRTNLLNLRDGFRFTIGIVQARRLMKRLNPDAVFLKGGFVCVPLSMAAAKTEAFIVTHDSDAIAGLSNRLAARYADVICTGMPEEYYSYPKSKMLYTGLPLDKGYRPYSTHEKRFLKEKYELKSSSKVVLVLGGSLGARRLNEWCSKALDAIAVTEPSLQAIIMSGKGNDAQVAALRKGLKNPDNVRFTEFSSELFQLMAVADVVVTRTGATAMAEAGAMQCATITIPSPDLSGGHQVKNAQILSEADATIYISEDQIAGKGGSSDILKSAIVDLLNDRSRAVEIGKKLSDFYPNQSASVALADLLTKKTSNKEARSSGSKAEK